MRTFRFFFEDIDSSTGRNSTVTWTKEYKNFSAASGQLTRVINKYVRIYGHQPKRFGVETIPEAV